MVTELFPLKSAFSRLSDEDPDMIETPDVDDIEESGDEEEDGVGATGSDDDDASNGATIE